MITTEDEIELPDTRILFHCLSFSSHVAGTKVALPFSLGLPRTFMAQQSNATDVHTAHYFLPNGTYMKSERLAACVRGYRFHLAAKQLQLKVEDLTFKCEKQPVAVL